MNKNKNNSTKLNSKSNKPFKIFNIPRKIFFISLYSIVFFIMVGALYIGTWVSNRTTIDTVITNLPTSQTQLEPSRVNRSHINRYFEFQFRVTSYRETTNNATFQARAIRNGNTPTGNQIRNIQFGLILGANWISWQSSSTISLGNATLPLHNRSDIPQTDVALADRTCSTFGSRTVSNVTQDFPTRVLGIGVSAPTAYVVLTWLLHSDGGQPTRHTYLIAIEFNQFWFDQVSQGGLR